MFDFYNKKYDGSDEKYINTFGYLFKNQGFLSGELKQLIYHEYWINVCKTIRKNEFNQINSDESNKTLVKRR